MHLAASCTRGDATYCSLKDQADEGPLQTTASEVPNKMLEISHVTNPVGHHKAHSHCCFVRHKGEKEDNSSALQVPHFELSERAERVFIYCRQCVQTRGGTYSFK